MSSLFRRTFSRRLPDHLLEISERIYVFDSCLSNATMNEKEFKMYLGEVVTSLQRFHAGASFMVFNFREGDQISLLSDILIDYDMTVVDYPRNHEGYPLLQLEMINYFLRSSESWLSLGQKNVILMHCEEGGWPVLAFMLAGLLLYRKQNNGEQKTLEMVYKMAPKQLFSVLSPINARASQLRYLQYITGRDLASDWPPPDAPLVVDYLLLHKLPLFDGGKGCRPVVRVYGQDPSEKSNRDPRLLLSTLMAEEPAWQYPKEECIVVKLELRCQVQGDVFLECIHLYNDLVTEELIFKVMFHTGFIQSNILALNSGDIDVPWNPKYQLPKDFKAEVLFRDVNEAPPQITMELGSGEEYHDSDNEFFEVEEIFTPMTGSPEKKAGLKITIDQEVGVLDSKNRDCTLHNGAPRWDLESELSDLAALKDIAFVEGNIKHTSENLPHIKDIVVTEVSSFKERDIDEEQPKEAAEWNNKPPIGADTATTASKNIVVDYRNYKQALKEESDIRAPTSGSESGIIASKNIVLVDDMHHRQALETNSDISLSENTVLVDNGNHKEASETLSEARADDGNDIPASAAEFAESVTSMLKNIVVDQNNHIQALEKEMDVSAPASGAESGINTSRNIVLVDDMYHKEASETQCEAEADHDIQCSGAEFAKFDTLVLKNIALDENNYIQALEKELDVSAPASGAESGIYMSRNIVRVDNMHHNEASEIQSEEQALEKEMDVSASASGAESGINMSRNIVLVNNVYHKEALETRSEAQALEKEMDVSAPASGAEPGINISGNIVLVDNMYHKEVSETQREAQALEKEMDVNAPASGAESGINMSSNIVLVDNMYHREASETQTEAQGLEKEMDISAPASGTESSINMSSNIVLLDNMYHKEASEAQPEEEPDDGHDTLFPGAEFATNAFKNILVDESNHIKALEKEIDASAPASRAESDISASKNIVLDNDRDHKEASERNLDISASKNTLAVGSRYHKEALETQYEVEASESLDIRASGAESVTHALKNIVADDNNHIQALEMELSVGIPPASGAKFSMSKDILLVDHADHKQASEKDINNSATKNIVVGDTMNNKEASETQYDINASKNKVVTVDRSHKQASDVEREVSAPKNIIVVDDGSQIQHVKVEIQPKSVPSSSKIKPNKRNKWQEITAKTITQQRVVSQWVPRTKPPAPETTKPKATAYQWVPKGAITPTSEK